MKICNFDQALLLVLLSEQRGLPWTHQTAFCSTFRKTEMTVFPVLSTLTLNLIFNIWPSDFKWSESEPALGNILRE